MGGAVFSACDNDHLVDKLKDAGYITTSAVEQAFRAVDRGDYALEIPQQRDRGKSTNPYEDMAWRSGNRHLSAPCIYTRVVEALELKEGLSFLNMGSGIGYLSTIIGQLLGSYGVNHGIELYEDNVQFAYERVAEFIRTASAFEGSHFCEPQFQVGNCLNINPTYRSYDRIYCGAACPPEHVDFVSSLLSVGGILIAPVGQELLKIRCIAKNTFEPAECIMQVCFSTMVEPDKQSLQMESITLASEPRSLMDACRIATRRFMTKSRWARLEELTLPVDVLQYLNYYRPFGEAYESTRFLRKNPPHDSDDEGPGYHVPVNGVLGIPPGFPAVPGVFPAFYYAESDDSADEEDDEYEEVEVPEEAAAAGEAAAVAVGESREEGGKVNDSWVIL